MSETLTPASALPVLAPGEVACIFVEDISAFEQALGDWSATLVVFPAIVGGPEGWTDFVQRNGSLYRDARRKIAAQMLGFSPSETRFLYCEKPTATDLERAFGAPVTRVDPNRISFVVELWKVASNAQA